MPACRAVMPVAICSLPRAFASLAVLLTVSAACAESHAPASAERAYGVISLPHLSSLPISVATPVHVGVPTRVVVRTYGSSTCDKPAGMDVRYLGTEVELVPWVMGRAAATACTDDLAAHQQEAMVVFAVAGTARIAAFGYIVDVAGTRRLGTVGVSVMVLP